MSRDLVTDTQAAAILEISEQMIREHIRRGRLTRKWIGGTEPIPAVERNKVNELRKRLRQDPRSNLYRYGSRA